jgi:hypothetical protein
VIITIMKLSVFLCGIEFGPKYFASPRAHEILIHSFKNRTPKVNKKRGRGQAVAGLTRLRCLTPLLH